MNLLALLIDAGLTLSAEGECLVVTPAAEITDPLRQLILEHKPELLAAVRDAERVALELVASINRCCDARGDMREHFNEQAAVWAAATGRGAV